MRRFFADFFLLSLLPQEIKDWCSNARSKWNYTRLCWKHICNQSSTLSVSLHDVKRFKACVGKKFIISDHLLNEAIQVTLISDAKNKSGHTSSRE